MMFRTIARVRAFLAPYPIVLPAVAVLGTVAALAEGFSIGLMIPFLASMMGDDPSGGGTVARMVDAYAGLFPESWRLVGVSSSVIVFVISACAISYAYIRLLSWAATRVTFDLRVRLFEQYFTARDMFTTAGSQGRQIKAIDGAAYRSGQAVINLCLLVTSACTTAVFAVLLVLISWKLTLIVVAGVSAAGLVVRLYVRRSLALSHRFEAGSAAVSDMAMQVMSSLRMVKIFGQERREIDAFAERCERVRQDEFRLESVRRSMVPLVDGLTVPILIAALVIAFYNGVSAAILLPFLFLVFRLQRYVREFDQSQVRLAADSGAIEEMHTLLEEARRPGPPAGTRPFSGLREGIVYDRVTFAHGGAGEDRGPSLREVSLEIPRGETLAIVGASGSGKSTLINLLVGLYVPSSGEIRIDGTPLGEIDLAAWRRRIGFAGQDADLRTGTIADNIAYGEPDAPRAAIARAAEQANIRDFIERLPEGFDTDVGARGLQLSGGERQRIALARALLRQPDLLILDEATNAVDNTSEAVIRGTLEALAGSLTMIVIAHRLSSIRHADRVLVLEGGRIAEIGRPEELLAAQGAFAELSRLEVAAR